MILFLIKNYLLFFAAAWIMLGFAIAVEITARVYRFVFNRGQS